METASDRNTATLIHLSTLTQYFIPFGSFIFPMLLWSVKRDSNYIKKHGKATLNFQLSVLLYSILIVFSILMAAAIFAFNAVNWNYSLDNFSIDIHSIRNFSALGVAAMTAAILIIVLKVMEFILIILGSVAALEGREYKYPLTINFIKNSLFQTNSESQTAHHKSST